MNSIIKKFLLTADRFMPETHLKDVKDIVLVVHLPDTRTELINSLKQTIQTIYTKMN